MILKEQNNQKKTLPDGMLDINHEQENTPTTNGKVQPFTFFLADVWFLIIHYNILILNYNKRFLRDDLIENSQLSQFWFLQSIQ